MLKKMISLVLVLGFMAAPAVSGMQEAPKQSWTAWAKEKASALGASATSSLQAGAQFVVNHKGKIMLATAVIAAAVAAKYAMDHHAGEPVAPVFFGPADDVNPSPLRVFADYCWKYLGCNNDAAQPYCDYRRIYDFSIEGIRGNMRDIIKGEARLMTCCDIYVERVQGKYY